MARIRTIKPEFFLDDDVAKLHPLTRILFIALWCLADKAGRLEDKPQRIKVQALPYDKHDIDAELNVLMQAGFIYRYHVDDLKLIEIKSFLKHQRPHNTEKESDLPPFNGEITVKQPLSNGEEILFNGALTTGRERKGKEGKGYRWTFVKPTLSEIQAYCQERKNNVDPQKFSDHYESNGWRVGKNAMKDWKAAIRTWERSDFGGEGNGKRQPNPLAGSGQPPLWIGDDIPDFNPEERQKNIERARSLAESIGTNRIRPRDV